MKSALCLVSSGIDSPVAGTLMLKELHVSFIYFDNQFSNQNNIQRKKVIRLMQKIANNTRKDMKLFVIDHEKNQLEFRRNCISRFQCVFCKRTMYRIAERIAEEENIDYILTGENIGQVASQTLNNLITQDRTVKKVILRPLLTFDKNDIIRIARQIGTYDLSIAKDLPCPFLPPNPITRSKPDQLEKQEENIDVERLIQDSLKTKIVIELKPSN